MSYPTPGPHVPPPGGPGSGAQIADGRDFYEATCGCGFTIQTSDTFRGAETYDNHCCPNRAEEYTPWYGFIFSFWGWLILATIGWVIVGVFS